MASFLHTYWTPIYDSYTITHLIQRIHTQSNKLLHSINMISFTLYYREGSVNFEDCCFASTLRLLLSLRDIIIPPLYKYPQSHCHHTCIYTYVSFYIYVYMCVFVTGIIIAALPGSNHMPTFRRKTQVE